MSGFLWSHFETKQKNQVSFKEIDLELSYT